jgi:hypothetical protein
MTGRKRPPRRAEAQQALPPQSQEQQRLQQ